MSSLWGKVFSENQTRMRIDRLTTDQCIDVVCACVHHAHQLFKTQIATQIPPIQYDIFKRAIDNLSPPIVRDMSDSSLNHVIDALYQLLPEEDSDEIAVEGWEIILIALARAYEFVLDKDKRTMVGALNQAYQCIAGEKLNSYMLRNKAMLAGEEIVEAEASIPECRDEVQFQLMCIERAEGGKAMPI
jgi:hypothetical protein